MIQVGKQIEKILAQKTMLNLATLAQLARIGKARLSKIVYQNAPPSIAELERLSEALGVSPSILVEDEETDTVEISLEKELVELLRDPTLAASLWGLGQLPSEDRQAIGKIIESFAQG